MTASYWAKAASDSSMLGRVPNFCPLPVVPVLDAKSQNGITGHRPCLVSGLEEMLSAIPGVQYAHVNLGAEKVTINYEDSVTGVESLIAVHQPRRVRRRTLLGPPPLGRKL